MEATVGVIGASRGTARFAVRLRGIVPARTGVVVVPVCTAAVAVLALACAGGFPALLGAPIALVAAATLVEAFPVPIEGVTAGETSFATVFIVTAAVVYGWQAAVLTGALVMLFAELYRRAPIVRLLYNVSLYALAAGAAGLIAQALSDQYRTGIVSSFVFYVVDVALLAGVIARVHEERYTSVARSFFRSTLAPFVVMAATTAILLHLWWDSPYWALLLAPPLVATIIHQRSLLAALKQQRELDRLKDEFIAVISHELRTPLASVYGGAVTLEERDLDAETRQRLVKLIRRESTRLKELVNDVLWASRLDAKSVSSELQPCDGVRLAREVASTAAQIAPENVTIVVDADPGLPHVTADPEHLRRVLANLVDNAVKYSPAGGTVEVAAQRRNGRVRFTVKDEGIGIPASERERIFEKFTRLDPQMRHGIGGSGLGLYICRELIGQMGGTIWATGNQATGSTLAFEVPTTTEGVRT
jgi:signal transduction histidine kinase